MKIVFNKKILFGVLVLGFSLFGLGASATEVAWPDSPLGTSFPEEGGINLLVQYIYEWGISLGGLAAFIALLIAGFQYLASAGNPTLMKEAKSRMVSAGIGLGLLLGSWLILNTISPQFTHFPGLSITPEITQPAIEPQLPPRNLFPKCEMTEITVYREGGAVKGKFHTIGTTCINIPEDIEGIVEEIDARDSLDVVFMVSWRPCTLEAEEPCYIDPGPDENLNTEGDNVGFRICQGRMAFYQRKNCKDALIGFDSSIKGSTGFNGNILSCKMLLTEAY